MRVLVCGSSGFVGRHVASQLRAAGHHVIEGRSAEMNFARDVQVASWLPRLQGVDAVINAVGVLRDSRARPMSAVHEQAPRALFEACAQLGVRRVIQVSALGIDGNPTLYARSKLAAETAVLDLQKQGRLNATVLRPSIVFGRGGASSSLFMSLARLPLLVLPAAAVRARVQPVSVHELAQVCLALLEREGPPRLDGVGPKALSLADFIASLRTQLGHRPARLLALPEGLSRCSARMGDRLPFQPWCSETLSLLQQDNVGEAAPFAALLGRPATAAQELVGAAWSA